MSAASAARITAVGTHGIRFPTSRGLDGSDAMHPDPGHSTMCQEESQA